MGKPKVQYVETTQKQELDPIAQGYLWSGQLPEEKLASLRRINERVYGYAPGTLTPIQSEVPASESGRNLTEMEHRVMGLGGYGSAQDDREQAEWEASTGYGPVQGPTQPGQGLGAGLGGIGAGIGDYVSNVGSAVRDLGRAALGMEPKDDKNNMATGGIVALANGGMVPPMMGGRMPNLSNQDVAYQMAMRAMRPRPYAMGGYIEGPGTGTSDSIPATIYQNGQPVENAALSDGEFVMTERAVRGAGNGDPRAGAARMYEMMRKFENGGKVR